MSVSRAFDRYIEHIAEQNMVPFPFVVLAWPPGIGKRAAIEAAVKKLLGDQMPTDYMALYDLEDELDKAHALKVSVKPVDQHIELDDGRVVHNLGSREIVEWLSLAPFGWLKVVYLEHIERMTISAANALLKTLEEPLPGRLIIATTTVPDRLLDTFQSRAFVMHMQTAGWDHLSEQDQQLVWSQQHSLIRRFVGGRLGSLVKLRRLSGEDREAVLSAYDLIRWAVDADHLDRRVYVALKEIEHLGLLTEAIDALIDECVVNEQISYVDRLLVAKRRMRQPIQTDHILFDLALPT